MAIDQCVFQAEGLTIDGFAELGFYGDFLPLVTAPPAALVAGFTQRDAINPGTQAGISVEAANAAVDLDEDFLRQIGRVSRSGIVRAQAINGLVIFGDQPRKRLL